MLEAGTEARPTQTLPDSPVPRQSLVITADWWSLISTSDSNSPYSYEDTDFQIMDHILEIPCFQWRSHSKLPDKLGVGEGTPIIPATGSEGMLLTPQFCVLGHLHVWLQGSTG